MTDKKETTAATWQDIHSGKRGHQLMTEKLADTIPAIGATDNACDYDQVEARAKLFSPFSNWTWFITEMDRETGQCFGLVEGLETELGYFDLTELAETTVLGGVPAVERDLYWQPMTLGEIKGGSQDGSRRIAETGETEGDISPADVVNVEEFLFGAAPPDAPADDNPDEVDQEPPAGDATDDVEEPETAQEADADADTAEESDTADVDADADDGDGTESPPAETDTSEELKVVLSIRGGRAVIGVQRPSADPHIEAFDDADLFELADQFPAVVARARAIWEEEPMHPAYDRPAPPPRQRNRRQPAANPPADTGAAEPEQPQAETLRLF